MELTRLPDISASDTEKAIKEIKSYIVRLNRQISTLTDNITEQNLSPSLREKIYIESDKKISGLKNEIIETADKITETGDRIELKLLSDYVAKSEIGEYTEQAIQNISVDGKGVTQMFTEISEISGRMDIAEAELYSHSEQYQLLSSGISKITAYIRTGKLDEGVYGIEIGNFSETSAAPYKVRLSENRLSFYIGQDEVAYFSDNSMNISRANIPLTLTVGGCTLRNDSGICFVCE